MNEFSSSSRRDNWEDTCADIDTRLKAVERAIAMISGALHGFTPDPLAQALAQAREIFAAAPLNMNAPRPELGVRYAAMLRWLMETEAFRQTIDRGPP